MDDMGRLVLLEDSVDSDWIPGRGEGEMNRAEEERGTGEYETRSAISKRIPRTPPSASMLEARSSPSHTHCENSLEVSVLASEEDPLLTLEPAVAGPDRLVLNDKLERATDEAGAAGDEDLVWQSTARRQMSVRR